MLDLANSLGKKYGVMSGTEAVAASDIINKPIVLRGTG
jgi:hypothetical protein